MSICTYNDGLFEVMIVDEETRQEIRLEGNRKLTDEEFDLIQKVAPACVWTPYQQL